MPFINGTGPVKLSRLRAEDVVRFVQRQARSLHPKRAKLLTTALRSFLQYACYRGDIRLDLATAVPCVTNWSMPSIPRGIAPDQVRRLLSQIDRSTAIGRRDYAILLLLARLGSSSLEVAFLELEDIDWKGGCLSVRGKTGRRPNFPCQKIWVTRSLPICGTADPEAPVVACFCVLRLPSAAFSLSAPSERLFVIRSASWDRGAYHRSPSVPPRTGYEDVASRRFPRGDRRTVRSQNPETTKIYTKVDLDALRTLALPWPGGMR